MEATQYDAFARRRKPARRGHPVVDPADWSAPEMAASEAWLHQFDEREIAELRTAAAPFDRDGVDLMALSRQDFPLPILGPKLAEFRNDLL